MIQTVNSPRAELMLARTWPVKSVDLSQSSRGSVEISVLTTGFFSKLVLCCFFKSACASAIIRRLLAPG
jgi:hypothetical protein